MIKKTHIKVKNDKLVWAKDQIVQQYNKAKKRNTYAYSDENGQNRFPASHTSKHQPLKQLSTNFQYTKSSNNAKNNRIKHNPDLQPQLNLRLNSQTSLNDLSPIASVEMSCSGKKDPLQKLQFMQNFDKLYRETIMAGRQRENATHRREKGFSKGKQQSINKNKNGKRSAREKGKSIHQKVKSIDNQEKIKTNHIKKELKYDDESINKAIVQHDKVDNKSPLQDFQILDIYSTSLLTVIGASQQSFMQRKPIQVEQKQYQVTQKQKVQIPTSQKSERKCGGIKKNSLTSTSINTSTQGNRNQTLSYNQSSKSNTNNNSSYRHKIPTPTNNEAIETASQRHKSTTTYNTNSKQTTHTPTANNNLTTQHHQHNNSITYQINTSSKQLFQSISINKTTISQQQMQAFPFTCEMRLILGPISTKFRQKKYSILNRQMFMKEYLAILKDFSQVERRQICQKIMSRKYYVFDQYHMRQHEYSRHGKQHSQYIRSSNKQSLLQQLQEQSANEFLQEFSYDYQHQIIQQPQSIINNTAHDRLRLLTSKVDTYLSRISEQYGTSINMNNNDISMSNDINNNNDNTNTSNDNYYCQPLSKKQKLSTLMSRLSEIEQISHDSQGLMSRISDQFADDNNNINSFRNNNINNICPHNNVYVNETLLFDEHDINDDDDERYREEQEESLIIEKVIRVDNVDDDRLQQQDKRINQHQLFDKHNNSIYPEREFASRLFAESPHSFSLTQSRQNAWISRESSLGNSRNMMKSQSRNGQPHCSPYIWQVNNDHSDQQTFHQQALSLRSSINLSFSELQKYLA